MTFARVFIASLASVLCLAHSPQGLAETVERVSLIEENDTFGSGDDRHYTQGIRFAYLTGDIAPDGFWNKPFGWLDDAVGIFPTEAKFRSRRIEWTPLGQHLFTPGDTRASNPSTSDRPYAGWLYVGATFIQDTDHVRFDAVQILVGVVGPSALGRQTQNDFHQLIDSGSANGWRYQLRDEPALLVNYDRKWRIEQPIAAGFGFDAIPQVGATVGNVLTEAEVGGLVRFGRNLRVDYGPARNSPGLNGTTYFNRDGFEDDSTAFYVYAGAQGRAVARNIFLDGNSLQSSRSVDKKPFVGDLVAGAAVYWLPAARLDFTVTRRSKEFDGQRGTDTFGTIGASFGW
jgi:lipid A 3-O-deacylase